MELVLFLTVTEDSIHSVTTIILVNMKKLSYKGLRQEGLIILELDCEFGMCLWISDSEFHFRVSLLSNAFF